MTSSEPITAQEAAALLGITRRGVTEAIRSGRLQARKLPGRTGSYLLDLEEVRKFGDLRKASA